MMEKMLIEMMLMPNDGDEMIGDDGGGDKDDGDDGGDVGDYRIVVDGGGNTDGSHTHTHTLRPSHDGKS